jgi:8-oxo-dGTP pyrophosphatase MutT (NUDIX family)
MAYDPPLFLVSAGVYLEHKGKILILERAAGAVIGFWSLPGGLLDDGESPEDCARRELFEEAGLRLAGPLTLVAVNKVPIYGRDAIRLIRRRGRRRRRPSQPRALRRPLDRPAGISPLAPLRRRDRTLARPRPQGRPDPRSRPRDVRRIPRLAREPELKYFRHRESL